MAEQQYRSMELANGIGLCKRNELVCKSRFFQLFSLSQPKSILHYPYAGGKQEFLLSVAAEGPIDDFPVPIIVANLSAAIPAWVPISVVQGMLVPAFPPPAFLSNIGVCVPTENFLPCLPTLEQESESGSMWKCSHLARPLHILSPTAFIKRFFL